MLNIRKGFDGSLWIPRQDQETEAYLDANYTRIPGALRWIENSPASFNLALNKYEGQTCYIVGKGPSLDLLSDKHIIEPGIVIGINEAIFRVEYVISNHKLYGIQFDPPTTSRMPKSQMILSRTNKLLPRYKDLEDTIVFDQQGVGLGGGSITAQMAIFMARHFGCNKVYMVCFDGALGGICEYAKCTGTEARLGGAVTRFKKHKSLILDSAKHIPLRWLLPTSATEMNVVDSLGG